MPELLVLQVDKKIGDAPAHRDVIPNPVVVSKIQVLNGMGVIDFLDYLLPYCFKDQKFPRGLCAESNEHHAYLPFDDILDLRRMARPFSQENAPKCSVNCFKAQN